MRTYFIVEFRHPYKINEKTPKAAAEKARAEFEAQYGFKPDLWNARVFEFSFDPDKIGAQNEYAFSPSGIVCFDIHKNYDSERSKDEST